MAAAIKVEWRIEVLSDLEIGDRYRPVFEGPVLKKDTYKVFVGTSDLDRDRILYRFFKEFREHVREKVVTVHGA